MFTSVAQSIPVKVRKIIYTVLGTLASLEFIFNFIDSGLENKLFTAAAVMGFSLAVPNTRKAEYNGYVNVETDDLGNKMFSLELAGDPTDIEFMDSISFKVKK